MKVRNLSLDLLKVLMAFMVVALHGNFLKDISPLGHYLTVNGVFRIAVPVFFLINGYYFVSILETGKLIHWTKRVVYLYALWMLFYAYFWFRPGTFTVNELMKIVEAILVGHQHLWYLNAMLGAGFLTFFVQNKSKLGVILATICYFWGVLIQYIGNYHVFPETIVDQIFNMYWAHRNFLFFGFPFFYLGYLINNNNLFSKNSTFTLVLLFLFGLGLLVGESWYNFNNPFSNGGFDNYISLIFVCPVLFIIAMRGTLRINSKFFTLISTAIYLIHPLWKQVLYKFLNLENTQLTLACLFFSIITSYLLIRLNENFKFIL
ncbi:acyltransferase family protein [Vibrio sp. JC009]|uniref:acyltransferase family protein n=1 Tax=Vibrio sp. JC009 TaxID=2912314 RepID=UPI0023AF91C7|nr:acyltransferase family protein [Vibrio sp. JC009]WED20609.1 acyltransferase family protein [Vibrio sp. JC009]